MARPGIADFPLRCAHCAHFLVSTEGVYCARKGGKEAGPKAAVTAYEQGEGHPCVEFEVHADYAPYIHEDTKRQINQWIKKHRMSENTPKGMLAK